MQDQDLVYIDRPSVDGVPVVGTLGDYRRHGRPRRVSMLRRLVGYGVVR